MGPWRAPASKQQADHVEKVRIAGQIVGRHMACSSFLKDILSVYFPEKLVTVHKLLCIQVHTMKMRG